MEYMVQYRGMIIALFRSRTHAIEFVRSRGNVDDLIHLAAGKNVVIQY